jgi:Fic family protein
MSDKKMKSEDRGYYYPEDNSLVDEGALVDIDNLSEKIIQASELNPELWLTIQQKYRIDWIYNSNAIEGSTLTRGETHHLLMEGRTAEGKPYEDHQDAINHNDAVDLLYGYIKDDAIVTEGMLKEFNSLLLLGVKFTSAKDQFGNEFKKPARPGQYKSLPNHVLKPDGDIHHYVDPLQVTSQMEELVEWLEKKAATVHPVIVAAMAHYHFVRIHPFDDGNGRGARILMNYILVRSGFSPAIVKNEKRSKYLDTLNEANNGNYKEFVGFIVQTIYETLRDVYSDIVTRPLSGR